MLWWKKTRACLYATSWQNFLNLFQFISAYFWLWLLWWNKKKIKFDKLLSQFHCHQVKSWQDRWNFIISMKILVFFFHSQSTSRQIWYCDESLFLSVIKCRKTLSIFILWRWEFKEIFFALARTLFLCMKGTFFSWWGEEMCKKSNGAWIVSVHDVCLNLNLYQFVCKFKYVKSWVWKGKI